MRYIDLEGHTPDQAWLDKSDELTQQLIELHEAGDIKGRNELIDNNSSHWGEIKTWLLSLSHNKCWFSEAKDVYSHLDVEHFRPKKEAKDFDGTKRDGYWWLAFDYSNFRACGNVGNRKKGGWFPLRDGSAVASYDNRVEDDEMHYLLDPTKPDDVILIAFDEEGKAIPAPGVSEWDEARVNTTIERLKLNEHEALTAARREVWTKTNLEIKRYFKAKDKCSRAPTAAAKESLKIHCKNILELASDKAELSSVAKWCVFFRNDPPLIRLLSH